MGGSHLLPGAWRSWRQIDELQAPSPEESRPAAAKDVEPIHDGRPLILLSSTCSVSRPAEPCECPGQVASDLARRPGCWRILNEPRGLSGFSSKTAVLVALILRSDDSCLSEHGDSRNARHVGDRVAGAHRRKLADLDLDRHGPAGPPYLRPLPGVPALPGRLLWRGRRVSDPERNQCRRGRTGQGTDGDHGQREGCARRNSSNTPAEPWPTAASPSVSPSGPALDDLQRARRERPALRPTKPGLARAHPLNRPSPTKPPPHTGHPTSGSPQGSPDTSARRRPGLPCERLVTDSALRKVRPDDSAPRSTSCNRVEVMTCTTKPSQRSGEAGAA
jgi:hypothetical protein